MTLNSKDGVNKGITYLLNCKVKIILRIMMGGELTDEVEAVPTHGNVHGILQAFNVDLRVTLWPRPPALGGVNASVAEVLAPPVV